MPQLTFKRNAHISYFKRCLTMLPSSAETHDGNRITIAYFCLSALDLLGALETSFTKTERQKWIEWVWKLQANQGGFRGSTFMSTTSPQSTDDITLGSLHSIPQTDPGHLPSTYTALLVLGILRAPAHEWVNKLDVDGLERFLCACADVNGSFSPIPVSQTVQNSDNSPPFQSDARMSYCAAVIHDFVTIAKHPRSRQPASYVPYEPSTETTGRRDVVGSVAVATIEDRCPDTRWEKRTREWLSECQTWEGGFAQHPGLEAQGGTTYCIITSLALLNGSTGQDNWSTGIDSVGATRYLVARQLGGNSDDAHSNTDEVDTGVGGGFQGRPGKDEDVCYSFWCGAAMRVLHGKALFDTEANTRALLNSQSPMGGFGKAKGDYPDPYHAYLALAALAMNEHEPKNISFDKAAECLETNLLAPASTEMRGGEQPRYPSLNLKALDPQWNVTIDSRAYIERCLGDIYNQKYADQGTSTPP